MTFSLLPNLRQAVATTARRLHENDWVANHDGNVSVRLKGERFLITPTAMSKRDVAFEHLIVVNDKAEVLEGRRKPFSEFDLHLAIYGARPDVHVVLHAHPPYSTALGLVGATLTPVAMPEVAVSLGTEIPTLSRTLPKSKEGAEKMRDAAMRADAVLCQGNGVFTFGKDLEIALLRMELVEHYAKILTLAKSMGTVPVLSEADLKTLLEARAKAGLTIPTQKST